MANLKECDDYFGVEDDEEGRIQSLEQENFDEMGNIKK
jgi:hypothetical protein